MATKTVLQKVLDLAGRFVASHDGSWGHEDWEDFLASAAAQGILPTDETKRSLGNILESSKYFHAMEPAAPKKTTAKAKPKKAKSK
ncbi:MAG: hypothetical protein HZB26_00010 [Candidatus Hydrogenedentes bacterium]|nr:hypothetical protein [Candidatus Hydrogenedentota bacterium]